MEVSMKLRQLVPMAAVVIALASLTHQVSTKAAPAAVLLASGLEGASGSAVGPDGALYVVEGAAGRISRVDPETGVKTTFASGLPPWLFGIGGAIDVAFIGHTAYTLVTLVSPDVGGSDVDGVYRIDGPNSSTVIADIGTFAIDNPPATPFDVPSGLQFALEAFHGGFLVSDGHHNRVLGVTLDGTVSEIIQFGNLVPTGLARWGNQIFLAQAGPVPHTPADGKIVAFSPGEPFATTVAAGAPLLVDVEFGPARSLYALSQGIFPAGAEPGTPALPDTGSLVRANSDGTFTVVLDGLNQPSSLELIGHNAYVVTLAGDVWKIDLRSRCQSC
jgi:sugar lactone lactonase YvrE